MKYIFCSLLLVVSVYSSDVLDLGDKDFKSGTENEDIMLVEFFAPWCGHCKRLAPEYETAATALSKADPPVKLAKVDCTEAGKDTCSKYGVSGYPTLKIFRSGEVSQDYDGPRDSAGIVSYMKKNSGPSSKELTDVEHLEKKLSKAEDVLVVGYFSNSDSDLYKRFMKAADKKRADFDFAHSLNADINAHAGHTDAIVVHRPTHLHAKFEANKEVLSDAPAATTLDITKFIEEKHLGLVGQIKPSNEESFKKPLIVAYFNVDFKRDPKGTRYWRNRVARVAMKFEEFTFAFASKSDYAPKLKDWGFDADSSEVKAIAYDAKKLVYRMEGAFSVDSFTNFVNEFKDDKLTPYIKSEDPPADNSGPVKVVVGKTFDEIVNDNSKDVLIEFYAPWCGHCKSLEPKYEELGEKFKDSKDIVIAKMDATANDVPPEYEVSGFPTIYWSPMGSKDSPKKYQGSREVNDFVEYIKKEATNPVELPKTKKKKKKEL